MTNIEVVKKAGIEDIASIDNNLNCGVKVTD